MVSFFYTAFIQNIFHFDKYRVTLDIPASLHATCLLLLSTVYQRIGNVFTPFCKTYQYQISYNSNCYMQIDGHTERKKHNTGLLLQLFIMHVQKGYIIPPVLSSVFVGNADRTMVTSNLPHKLLNSN
jgi:hypothetical protein